MNDLIKEKLKLLPEKPGCYLMKDKNGKIIYVGKAKILKNRVKSYFTGAHNLKTTKLVSEICDFEYIQTNTATECLVLEINLIKEHDPKYNIMLTDDKTYPYILLTNELNPRLLVYRTKHKSKKDGKYFGPYPNVSAARQTCDLLNKIYPLRKCVNIPKKECLYYSLKQCLAPCINKEKIDYTIYKEKIISFLNGNTKELTDSLKEKMLDASNNLNFEKALEYRNLINDITLTTSHQIISQSDLKSKDVFGFYASDTEISIHVLYVRNGSIVENYHTIFSYVGDITDTLEEFIFNFYQDDKFKPKELIIKSDIDKEVLEELLEINIIIPQKGIKNDLAKMANDNALKDFNENHLLYQNQVLKKIDTIENLGKLLDIDTPYTIEAFDNSNLFGEFPVSAMVSYKNGRPSPKDFRKYHIKTVVGANDYESMKEVVYRRYFRLLMEGSAMPNLIVMDGGEIQVNACLDVLKSLNIDIPVIGLQKDDYHTFKYIYYKNNLIEVDKNSDIYLLLVNISQKVHDFAISFFRSEKTKGMFKSKLDGIKGLGPKKKEALLKKFITIEGIKEGSLEDFKSIGINLELRDKIISHLSEKK